MSGSFSLNVCSITLLPAKPISAPGSAILKSPSIAKEAVTPPVVGSVNNDRDGPDRDSGGGGGGDLDGADDMDDGTDPLAPQPLEDRDIFELLGFD